MTVFDTLGQLETYLPRFHSLQHVITIMDRSLPYDNPDGDYTCAEDSDVTYMVSTVLTSRAGQPVRVEEGSLALIIALEGQELVSGSRLDEVYVLSQGRFVILGPGEWKRSVMSGDPAPCRDVVFTLPMR